MIPTSGASLFPAAVNFFFMASNGGASFYGLFQRDATFLRVFHKRRISPTR
jgi:hypothetical protein